jgi:iron-sulfur cluster assembly accessory protein
MITVTETAASKISELLTEENKSGSGLRVFVQGGGCSGFQYGLMIEENGQGAADSVYESHGVKLYIDPISVRYLKGAGSISSTMYGWRLHNQESERHVDLRLRQLLLGRVSQGVKLRLTLPSRRAGSTRLWLDVHPDRPILDISTLTPAGSTLKQARPHPQHLPASGHLSADDLCDPGPARGLRHRPGDRLPDPGGRSAPAWRGKWTLARDGPASSRRSGIPATFISSATLVIARPSS